MEISKRVEKYIEEHTKETYNCDSYGMTPFPWLTPDQARKAVEIAREEMIKKVCDYLESIWHRYVIDGLKNILKK